MLTSSSPFAPVFPAPLAYLCISPAGSNSPVTASAFRPLPSSPSGGHSWGRHLQEPVRWRCEHGPGGLARHGPPMLWSWLLVADGDWRLQRAGEILSLLRALQTPAVPASTGVVFEVHSGFDSACSAELRAAKEHWFQWLVMTGAVLRIVSCSLQPPAPACPSAGCAVGLLLPDASPVLPDSESEPGPSGLLRSFGGLPVADAWQWLQLSDSSVASLRFSVCRCLRRERYGTDFYPPILSPGFRINIGHRRMVRAKGGGEYPVVGQVKFY